MVVITSWSDGKVSAQVLQKLMRHSDIKITMGYYPNVDDAVMDAVLGISKGQCNSLCNTPKPGEPSVNDN